MVVISLKIDLAFDNTDGELCSLKIQGHYWGRLPGALLLSTTIPYNVFVFACAVTCPCIQPFINRIIAVDYQQNCSGRCVWGKIPIGLPLKKILSFIFSSETDVFWGPIKIP